MGRAYEVDAVWGVTERDNAGGKEVVFHEAQGFPKERQDRRQHPSGVFRAGIDPEVKVLGGPGVAVEGHGVAPIRR